MAPTRLDDPIVDTFEGAIPSKKAVNVKPADDDIYGHYEPADPSTLNLESNFGPMDADAIGYLQPTSVNTPLEIMRERFERDGYLFVSHDCYTS